MLLISAPTILALVANIMLITGAMTFLVYDARNRRRKKKMMNNNKLTEEEYFFYEWLILDKGITREKMEALTNEELEQLKKEFKVFESNLKPKPLRG